MLKYFIHNAKLMIIADLQFCLSAITYTEDVRVSCGNLNVASRCCRSTLEGQFTYRKSLTCDKSVTIQNLAFFGLLVLKETFAGAILAGIVS